MLVRIPLPDNVSLVDYPDARSVVLRRGIPSTLNIPAHVDTLIAFLKSAGPHAG